jgi:sulfite exporter TauE/SafE
MEGDRRMMIRESFRHYLKIYAYALLGAGVTGIGFSFALDLNKIVVFPLVPDILDSISIIAAGVVLLYEVIRETKRENW